MTTTHLVEHDARASMLRLLLTRGRDIRAEETWMVAGLSEHLGVAVGSHASAIVRPTFLMLLLWQPGSASCRTRGSPGFQLARAKRSGRLGPLSGHVALRVGAGGGALSTLLASGRQIRLAFRLHARVVGGHRLYCASLFHSARSLHLHTPSGSSHPLVGAAVAAPEAPSGVVPVFASVVCVLPVRAVGPTTLPGCAGIRRCFLGTCGIHLCRWGAPKW